jgi:CheY-like chemotaxis protein
MLDEQSNAVPVVEDRADVADSLAVLLRLHGIDVEIARDGIEGLAVAERMRPDLVLLDLGMPRLDGFATCRELRTQPWGRELRVVAVTGWGQEGDRERSAAAGFDAHWIKPVAPAAVLEQLASIRARRGQ